MWYQRTIQLRKPRGFHLITNEVENSIPEISKIKTGMLNVFIQHTSASLAINENADPTVRVDLETHFNNSAPEGMTYYRHNMEGDDDMPAHIKSVTIGCSLNIPVTNGSLNLGIWQGIYLCEHRDHGGNRKIVITLFGE